MSNSTTDSTAGDASPPPPPSSISTSAIDPPSNAAAGASPIELSTVKPALEGAVASAAPEQEKEDAVLEEEQEQGASEKQSIVVEMEKIKIVSGLSEEQRKRLEEQGRVEEPTMSGYFTLFRFATKGELCLNAIGLLAAVVAGAAQPLMTVVFGALTTQFTNYGLALAESTSSPEAAARLEEVKQALFREVNKDVLYLLYIGIGMLGATYIYMAAFVYSGECNTRRIREAYLKAVLRQEVSWFDRTGAGAVTTKITTDTHQIQEGISDKIPMSVMSISTFLTGLIVGLIVNWRLTLVMCTIVPCIFGVGTAMSQYIGKYIVAMLGETAQGASLVEEVVSSIRNAHAFGAQNKLAKLYDEPNVRALEGGMKVAVVIGAGRGGFYFIIYASYALAFFYGGILIVQGHSTSGEVVTAVFAVIIGAFALSGVTPNVQAFSHARAAATSIFATIDRVPVIDSASSEGTKPDHVAGTIEIKDLDFIYPSRPAVQVLYKFNAVFPRGKMTALVGGSGSGKSTIIGLIERFYDPVGGSVKLDGIELKDLNLRWLRTQIGLVSQEPTLFATTVAGNIEHGLIGTKFEDESPEMRRKRVIEAAVQANADGFITALPEGYDTMIGERGMLLSGGQKQRIAIARAIVGDPQILLLDEATSALDTASEVIVQDALDRASAGRTTITIAHRLSTIKDADQIIVLTAGHILESAMTSESGSAHDALLKNTDGAYSRLVNAQRFREQEEEEDDDSSTDEKAPVPGELAREQLEEMARNEKPQFETLERTQTGRSVASEAIEEKRQRDFVAGVDKELSYSFFYLIKRMLQLNSAHYRDILFAVVAAGLAGSVYPVSGICFGGAIEALGLDPSTEAGAIRHGGNSYGGYYFAIAVIATVVSIVQSYYFSATAEHMARTLRLRTFSAILRQDIAFFDRDENSTGRLTAQVTDLAQKVTSLFGVTGAVLVEKSVCLIIGAVIGLCFGWRLALVGIATIPIAIGAGYVRLRVVVVKDVKNKKSHEQSAQMACEAAGAIRTVASLTREDDCVALYSKYLEEPMRVSNRTALVSNAYYSLSQALSFWIIGLIFWYGSHQLVDGALTSRTFFITMISIVFSAIESGGMFSYVPDMSKARGAAADAARLLDSRPEIDAEESSGTPFDSCEGHIRFKDVHFRYPTRPHVRVLRGLDLEVLPGQFVAIVGPSGCGKSTLIQLVERFYDPLSGEVQVDGQDISELNVQGYRKQVSLVSQEPTLYAGSVRFNITLGATIPEDQVTQEQIEQACRNANIHDFVMSLPDGYDTEVGGKGTQLSGGQKQRIAIARALIRNPKILLLDEATSALDSESEKVVQTALDQAAKGRSTIVVAHRLSTIQAADVIVSSLVFRLFAARSLFHFLQYVLRDGKVAEKGKHFELLAKTGFVSVLSLLGRLAYFLLARSIYYELVAQQSLEKQS
ncbi:P-loop containing nucleoside triphosphate hydrolase protein [Leucosporidium creatinivorum]|uniref:p-loop containing nucleoside triphosphate hydrolase protein n=1 Tax=Leucosporidium creatinivorum TaxID=106004 RepID=A0A1Y2CQI7_9BASI|nr:P-loop containing nucleoside triphosphate hydrolase protein [Leucosporidium creatinivorum]